MTLAEKIKAARKQAGMSQEKLAEKLGVSRQAVTKWETDGGIPDIENLMAISALFGISIDELLSGEDNCLRNSDFLFESITECDIDCPKRYDMNLGAAKKIVICGYNGEKMRVRLASDTLSSLQSDFKLKIDNSKSCTDLDMSRLNGVTAANAKEGLFIFVQLPVKYISKIEFTADAEYVELYSAQCDIEFNGKAGNVIMEGIKGTTELDCNIDMTVDCRSLNGSVEINQLSSCSKIFVPEGTGFAAVKKGIGNRIYFEKAGKAAEAFDDKESNNIIELGGIKSELIICEREE